MNAHPHHHAYALAQRCSRTDDNQSQNTDVSTTTSINSTTAMGESTNGSTVCISTTVPNTNEGTNTDPPKKLSAFHFTPVPFRPRSPSESTSTGPPSIVSIRGNPVQNRYRRKPQKAKRQPRTYTVEELQKTRLLRYERAKARKEEKEKEKEKQERERMRVNMEAAHLSSAIHTWNRYFNTFVWPTYYNFGSSVNTEVASCNWGLQPSHVSFLSEPVFYKQQAHSDITDNQTESG